MRMGHRSRRHRVARESETSRGLGHARRAAGLTVDRLANALELDRRTVRRWERGEAIPREQQWLRVLTFYAAHAPEIAEALAERAGRVLPHHLMPKRSAPPVAAPIERRPVDPLVASHVVATAADALDLAPKRGREVLRAALRAAIESDVSIEGVVLAVYEDPSASVA